MRYLLAMLQTLTIGTLLRRWAFLCVWITALCPSVVVVGCGPGVSTANTDGSVADLKLVKEQLRPLCWEPPEVTAAKANGDDDIFFAFVPTTGEAVTSHDRWVLDQALFQHGFVFKYDVNAPLENVRLVPLSRAADAWCSRIPRPTEEAALKLLDPCAEAASVAQQPQAAKALLGQTVPTERTSFLCGQRPQMAPTTQASISLLQRNMAYQSAYEQAQQIAKALTKAEAEMESVINKSDGWLKRALTEDPGTIEQIQQRTADQLNLIEAPAEYEDPYLEMLALAGYNAGFEQGRFDVKAKLFAIDAGIFILEMVALEVALGPLGGAKAIVSVVGKGAKAVTTVAARGSELLTTKGGQALAAAMKRLENIPIFIPGATGGVGAATTVGTVLKAARSSPSYLLHKAMKAAGIDRPEATAAHHIVAFGSKWAGPARKKLAEFGIKLNDAVNGVYLPRFMKSPNPTGAIVHAILGSNKEYYRKVNNYLGDATSKADLIKRLERIRETLLTGKFFNENL